MLNLSSTDSSLQSNKEPAKMTYSSPRKNMSEKFEPSPFGKYFGSRKSKNTAVDMNDFSSWKNKNYRKVEEENNSTDSLETTKPFSLSEYLKSKSMQKYNELDQAKTELKKPITQLSTEDPDYKKYSLDSYMHKLEEDIISKNKFEKNDDLLEPLSKDEDVMPNTNQDEDFTRSNVDLDEDAFDEIGPGEKFSLDRSELEEVKKRLDRIERESANNKEKPNQGVITGEELKEQIEEDREIVNPVSMEEISDTEESEESSVEETEKLSEQEAEEETPLPEEEVSESESTGPETQDDEELFKSDELISDDIDSDKAEEEELSEVEQPEDETVDFVNPYDEDDYVGYDGSLGPPPQTEETSEDDEEDTEQDELSEEEASEEETSDEEIAEESEVREEEAEEREDIDENVSDNEESDEIVAEQAQKSKVEEELETKIAELTEKNRKADEEANEKLRQIQEEKDRDYREYQDKLRGMEESYNEKYERIREQMLFDRLNNERKLDEFHSRLKFRESEDREQQVRPASNMKQISAMLSKELKSNHNISNLESDNKLLQISNKLKKQEDKKVKESRSKTNQSSARTTSSKTSAGRVSASAKKSKTNLDIEAKVSAPKRRRRGKSRRRIDSDIIGTIDFD